MKTGAMKLTLCGLRTANLQPVASCDSRMKKPRERDAHAVS
ncbi:hypothetical protein RRSWK_02845 [Rhodopirellula sp. SWK7]|nr:hypothetical protein RRSWK_02845 [Rhodopirellula sp. SWK7]